MQRVLVIDDDRLFRREVNRTLSKAGYEVIESSEPVDGIHCAKHRQPDLILLDVLMPTMDGISVLRQLRQHPTTQSIPVIMVTSLGSEDQVAACLEEGAIDHIKKPLSHRMLCARVSAGLMKDKMRVVAEQLAASPTHSSTGQIVGFLGAKGGVGTTTVAANAASVCTCFHRSAILCELRSTFGSLSLQLNTRPREHLGTLMKAEKDLSQVDWDAFLTRDSSGLRVLFGPQVEDGDIGVQPTQAKLLIEALRPHANLIFLDLSVGLTNLNVEILKLCDRIVLVLDCEPTSIIAATHTLDQLRHTTIRKLIKAVVVKRTEFSIPPKINDIQAALDCDLIGVIPPGADALAFAVQSGAPLVTLQPEDIVSTAIRRLTEEHLLLEKPVAAAVI